MKKILIYFLIKKEAYYEKALFDVEVNSVEYKLNNNIKYFSTNNKDKNYVIVSFLKKRKKEERLHEQKNS